MILQIRKFQVKQGNSLEICQQAARELPPILSKLPGFLDYYIVNGNDQSVFSITVFQDQQSLDQAFERIRQWSRENVRDKLGEPEIIQGEVIYATLEKSRAA